MSSDGNFCSMLWPEQSEYAVYATDSAGVHRQLA